ncbi:MAG: hypothetical protein IPH32_15185 [Bacteroidetes bacterium]|nr:hypothetical protein [Bacteroidota bacterium]
MQIDKKEIKPITDVLGLAVLDSQRLEYSIGFLMLISRKDFDFTNKKQDEEIDEYMLNLSKKTLGNLIKQLKELTEVNDEFIDKLEEALDARNYLIHRFLNHQGEKLLTKDGRIEVLNLVKQKRKILYECYFFLDPFIQIMMKIRGFPLEYFTKEISEKYEREQ